MIPELTKGGIDRYVRDGCMPGSFVRAVLENDLREAFARADENNTREMFSIVEYCYNKIPGGCWGSPARVNA
jgi:hypothetical protein